MKKTIKVGTIKTKMWKLPIGHKSHITGTGPHKKKVEKRNTRKTAAKRAIEDSAQE